MKILACRAALLSILASVPYSASANGSSYGWVYITIILGISIIVAGFITMLVVIAAKSSNDSDSTDQNKTEETEIIIESNLDCDSSNQGVSKETGIGCANALVVFLICCGTVFILLYGYVS